MRDERTQKNRGGFRGSHVAAAAAALAVPLTCMLGVTPASAVDVTIPVDGDVQARLTTHVGWAGDVAAAPSDGDCVRYGAAPAATSTGTIANTGGSAGTAGAAWSDGATEWVTFDDVAYTAHGTSQDGCLGPDLDLSAQSAIGFAPASITSMPTGVAVNLGRVVHRNNPVFVTNDWYHGVLDIRFSGVDLRYEWKLHETPNQVSPAGDPANNDIVEFVTTIADQTLEGPDGNRYTLVVQGFTAPDADDLCAPVLTEVGEAINRFETVEQTSTFGCLYATIQQVRPLTVTKVVASQGAAPASIPAFDFVTTTSTPGSAWESDFALTPTGVGPSGAVSMTADIVAGETVEITEAEASAPWTFTDLACVDGTGAALEITSGGTIAISGDMSVADPDAAPVVCTYTNTYAPTGVIEPTPTPTPPPTPTPTETPTPAPTVTEPGPSDPPAEPSATAAPPAPGGALAVTGSEPVTGLVAAGAGLVMAGIAAAFARRRRHDAS